MLAILCRRPHGTACAIIHGKTQHVSKCVHVFRHSVWYKDKVLISASHLLSLHLLHLLCLLFVPKFAYYLSECRAGCDDMLNWSWSHSHGVQQILWQAALPGYTWSSFLPGRGSQPWKFGVAGISAKCTRGISDTLVASLSYQKASVKALKQTSKKTNQAMYFDWGWIVVRLQWFMSIVKYKLSFSTALMSTIDKWWWFLRFCTVFANCAALALKLSSRQEPDAAGIPALAYFTGLHWALNNGKLVHDVSSYVLIDFVWDMLRQLTENIENTDDVIIISWKTLEIVGKIELFQSYFCVIFDCALKIPQVETVSTTNSLHPWGQGVGCGSVGLSLLRIYSRNGLVLYDFWMIAALARVCMPCFTKASGS